MQVEMLGLQERYGGSGSPAVRGSEPWVGVWGGEDVVDAELDLWFRLAQCRVELA